MKVWCVCAWSDFYPDGGIGNINRAFDTEEAAREYLKELEKENIYMVEEAGQESYEWHHFDNISLEVLEVEESMEGFR